MQQVTEQSKSYWNSFYSDRTASPLVPTAPSAFAVWSADRIGSNSKSPIVEFGFGTARDSLWFADKGYKVTGYDFAQAAITNARSQATARGLSATFNSLDLLDAGAAQLVARETRSLDFSPVLYGRFLIHSLEERARLNFFDLTAEALDDSGELYLEFRTAEDKNQTHMFGEDHYRVYLRPEVVAEEIEQRGGRITHLEEGHGLAVYKSEDPVVARLVATWTV